MHPFSTWSRMMTAALAIQRIALRSAETLTGSWDVIHVRLGIINDAGRSPCNADVGELSRMIPEKLDAFGRSGQSVMLDLTKMHAEWWSQAQRAGQLFVSGRTLTLSDAARLAGRVQEYGLSSVDAAVRMNRAALAPVHRAAMNNARHLRATKPREASR
jgi:hypothetical protein